MDKTWIRLQRRSKLIGLVSAISVFLLSIILIAGIGIFTLNISKNYKDFRKITNQRQKLQSEANFWKSVSEKYDGYKDAYFRKALSEYKLGQFDKAYEDNQKALLFDPNFEDAKKLRDLLDKAY